MPTKKTTLLLASMGAGLAWAGSALAQVSLGITNVVINEIHCDPPNAKTYPTEFIELYNRLPNAVDLSGWAFTRGIRYTFPPSTTLAAHGYLVVAESPALVARFFAATALGPWLGTLANEGETIELVDGFGAQVDTVSYGSGFPWPTVGDEPERSLQLINEGLDRQLGGSWRSAPPLPVPAIQSRQTTLRRKSVRSTTTRSSRPVARASPSRPRSPIPRECKRSRSITKWWSQAITFP